MADAGRIIVAGAGIAGLTAAIAFAARGFSVTVFERAAELAEIGAGLQLSPNASRILDSLGVLPHLSARAVQPQSVVLRRASDLREIARIPLDEWGKVRWRAPYLTAHRADLQTALLTRAGELPQVRIVTAATLESVAFGAGGPIATVTAAGHTEGVEADLLVGADGVWSTTRRLVAAGAAGSRFSGKIAWRATLAAGHPAIGALAPGGRAQIVTALLDGDYHLVAYPMRGGAEVNLAGFTSGADMHQGWSGSKDAGAFRRFLRRADPRLQPLAAEAITWTSYPIYTVDPDRAWLDPRGLVLIGDAAHAMTPFAAQGAAMAIEDAETLARAVSGAIDLRGALLHWQAARKERVARVARRGALNHLAWSASGPVAVARDLVLRLRSPESLAADLDWLYGWEPPGKAGA